MLCRQGCIALFGVLAFQRLGCPLGGKLVFFENVIFILFFSLFPFFYTQTDSTENITFPLRGHPSPLKGFRHQRVLYTPVYTAAYMMLFGPHYSKVLIQPSNVSQIIPNYLEAK